jgi:ribosome-binding protein aMBF1 (putative translation factor)
VISLQQFAARAAMIDALIESIADLETFLDLYLLDDEEIGTPPNGHHGSENTASSANNLPSAAKSEDEIVRSVAERIKNAREAKGLRQQDLAEITGIARPNIARLESGRRMPKIGTLKKIAQALHIRIEELMEL